MENKIKIFYKRLEQTMNGFTKHYIFDNGINVVYATNQCGKTTLINSILLALGAEETIFNRSELKPEKAILKSEYWSAKNKQFEVIFFSNNLKGIKNKHNDFFEKNIGLEIYARIDNKYGTKKNKFAWLRNNILFSAKK